MINKMNVKTALPKSFSSTKNKLTDGDLSGDLQNEFLSQQCLLMIRSTHHWDIS
jgi:hypothetical protein